jgi:N-acetylglucosamine-6-phosphate deacetylase
MSDLTVTGGNVLTRRGLERADVHVSGGRIEAVGPPTGPGNLDATGLVVAPGFVDTHVHGALGANFMMGAAALPVVAPFLLSQGVTSVCAATASLPRGPFEDTVAGLAGTRGRTPEGLDVLGIHLEGPFLSPSHRGVHRRDAVRPPAPDEVRMLLDLLDGSLRIVTLAPENPGAIEAIGVFREAGVAVSLGHSGADGRTLRRAVKAGASRVTHLYNAVPEPADSDFVEETLRDPSLTCELICDGHHVEPRRIAETVARIGTSRIAVVSDGSDVTGLPDGPHRRWEGTDVIVSRGESRTPAGVLAGSVCPLSGSLRILVRQAGIGLADALTMLSTTPARSIGADTKGRVEKGADADLVLVDPRTLEVRCTIAGGRRVYDSSGGAQ